MVDYGTPISKWRKIRSARECSKSAAKRLLNWGNELTPRHLPKKHKHGKPRGR